MLTFIMMLSLAAGIPEMMEPAAILTTPTRELLAQKVEHGFASSDEMMWYTLDAIVGNMPLSEVAALEKVLKGSPYAEDKHPLVQAAKAAITLHRGNRSGLIVFQVMWTNIGGAELDRLVHEHEDDWRYHLLRGATDYWTPSHYGRCAQAIDDLELAYNHYLTEYGWDVTLAWMRLWEGNLARRNGDISHAREIWQSLIANGPKCHYVANAEQMMRVTQSQ